MRMGHMLFVPDIFTLKCMNGIGEIHRNFLLVPKLQLGNEYNWGKTALAFLQAIAEAIALRFFLALLTLA